MPRILVVEDNRELADGLRTNLEFEGYDTELAHDGTTGLMRGRTGRFDLVILDLMLPSLDGFRVLGALRDAQIRTPVIVLTAKGDEEDKVHGLQLGADDYVTKPFGLREFLARVRSQLRRTAQVAELAATDLVPVRLGSIEFDPAIHAVRKGGSLVPLRPKEYELLEVLLRHRGRLVSREELFQEVWGYDVTVTSRTLDTHIGELRKKLEDDPSRPRWILTVRKTGYRVNLDG